MKQTLYTYTVLAAGALFMASCSIDNLDLAPPSAIGSNGFYTTIQELEGAVVAIYDGLQQLPLREFALTEMRSDNTETKSSEGDWAQFESYNVEPTNLAVGEYWTVNYNVIYRANTVLANIEIAENPSMKDQFEGEAKFARALAHFNLVRAYGDVPLLDKVVIQSETDYFRRDPVSDVLVFIEADLEDAAGLLPTADDIAEGRATSGAANALLAKVRLTQGDYSGAQEVTQQLISAGPYQLMEDYHEVFYTELNSEVIFTIPYLNDDINESQDFSFEMTDGGVASGLNYITDDFNLMVDDNEVMRELTLFNPDNFREVGKFITQSSDVRLCGNDWIVLRYADVLLMHAEAIMAGGGSTTNSSAVDAFNQVRARAGLSTLNTGDALTRDMLLQERRIELAFENHRLYDLVRFGVAEEVLGDFASDNNLNFSPTDLLLPIPQGEINVSQGLLTQNPGY